MKNLTKSYKTKIKQNTLTIAIDSTYLPENIQYPQLLEDAIFDNHYHAWHELFFIGDQPLTFYQGPQSRQYSNCILIIPPMVKHYTIRGKDYRIAVSCRKHEEKGSSQARFVCEARCAGNHTRDSRAPDG